ncbi:MAG: phenylalanine--tRNA ligase subunit beta [Patescibacteria group bacterium]
MKFSYNWLKKFVAIKESPEKLAEFLMMRAFEVDGVEKIGDDWALEIKLPPNRVPDAIGHIGMAQEIATLQNLKFKIKNLKLKESKKKTSSVLAVRVDDKEKCKRYIGRVIENVRIAESPEWMKEALISCGFRSINNIVDATNYVMLETGQPLHIFDYEKIEGGEIIVRRAKHGEHMKTLDNQDVVLAPDDLVIADTKSPLALAGIKGGNKAEVDVNTKHIVLESANFEGSGIRATTARTGIKTDSSYRFEHNPHPDLAFFAMERLAIVIKKVAGGECLKDACDVYPKKEKTATILFHTTYANSLLGLSLKPVLYKSLLLRIGCVVSGSGNVFRVLAPPFRRDIVIEEDLTEETARMYGYERIPEELPRVFIPAVKNDALEWRALLRKTLASLYFTEIYRYAFVGERDIKKNALNGDEHIKLENPISPDLSYLVREPYENFFRFVVGEGERGDIDVFSIDKGFLHIHGAGADTPVNEQEYLTILSAKDTRRIQNDGKDGFYALKGSVSEIMDSFGIDDYWFDGDILDKPSYPKLQLLKHLHPQRRVEIKIGDETIGVFGEVHPSILENWKIDRRVYIAEFLLSALVRYAQSEIEFREIPKFPAIERDIALMVGVDIKIEDAQGVIENAGGAILEDVDFFDEYVGVGVPDGMRSLAFRLVFRDSKRTLTEKEIESIMEKIGEELREKNWEIR